MNRQLRLQTLLLSQWSALSTVDQYARKLRSEHLQPSLFDHRAQPHLEGLGPGRWITIHNEDRQGQHVFVGDDGKMKTGKFAGKALDEAFGKKKKGWASGKSPDDDSGPKPGIVKPSKPTNDEAKPGDQLGLFGDADRAKKPGWKPSLLDTRGKQGSLFDADGDPDQKLLFPDGVTPDDMVYHPEAAEPESKESPKKKKVATPERRILGKRAGSAKVIGALIQDSISRDGHASLLGHTVKSAEDLASLAQVYRNASYETFRAFLVKDGKVVAHNAYSSRAPGLVMIPPHVVEHLTKDMAATGADGYYLLHNHPSGDPQPSREDLTLTQKMAEVVPGMIDHVIINHTKGAVISPKGESRGYSLENEDLNDLSRAKGSTEYLNHVITSPESLGQLAKKLEPKNKGRAVMIFCNVKLKSRMILDLDSNELKDKGNKNFQIAGAIRRASRQVASTERFLVLGEGEKYEDYAHLINTGLVIDIVAPSQGDSAASKGHWTHSKRLEEGLRGGIVTREKFSNYEHRMLEREVLSAWTDRYAARAEPSLAQREAGNYRMEHIRLHGLAISIETKKGQRRKPHWPQMPCDYGYIRGSLGRDGDHVDVLIGPNRESELVIVVDQLNERGGFDEHKCCLGFSSEFDAVACYKSAYTKGWKVGPVTTMTIGQFKAWLDMGDQAKELSKQVSRYWNRGDDDLRLDPVPVVDRYEWNAQDHPRNAKDSPGGVGGRFRSTKKRELAARPDTIRRGHPLHLSALDKSHQSKLTDWHQRMRQLLKPMEIMPPTVTSLSRDQQRERGWAKVDKDKVREMLAEMNQWNRDAEGKGLKLHEFVNANGLIPLELAERLDGGSKFFDPEKLGSKFKAPDSGGSQIKKGASNSLHDAVSRALGVQPAPPAEKPAKKPKATHKPKQSEPNDGLTTQARNRLSGIAGEVVGDGDEAKKEHFIKTAIEAWKLKKTHAEQHNDALRQVTAFFGKHHGALAANIAKGLDPSRIKGFDELVDHAAREYPQLVAHVASESEPDSHEQGLIKALREGIRKVPQPWDDEVIDQAMEMVGPGFFEDFEPATADADEWEAIPFSVRSDVKRFVQRYWLNESTQIERDC